MLNYQKRTSVPIYFRISISGWLHSRDRWKWIVSWQKNRFYYLLFPYYLNYDSKMTYNYSKCTQVPITLQFKDTFFALPALTFKLHVWSGYYFVKTCINYLSHARISLLSNCKFFFQCYVCVAWCTCPHTSKA